MKRKSIAILLLALAFALTACAGKQEQVYIKSAAGDFYITAPEGYAAASPGELNTSADLEAYNEDKSAYIIAIMEEKTEFSQVDFLTFSAYVKANIESNYEVTLTQKEDTRIASHSAQAFEFETTSEGVHMQMWCYTVETEHYYGQLYVWTLKSMEEEYQEELTAIALSFLEGQAPSQEE